MSFIAFGPNCGHRGLVKSDRWAHCRTGWPLTVWPFALLMLIFASSTALLCLPCSCCGKGGGRDGGKKQNKNQTGHTKVKWSASFRSLICTWKAASPAVAQAHVRSTRYAGCSLPWCLSSLVPAGWMGFGDRERHELRVSEGRGNETEGGGSEHLRVLQQHNNLLANAGVFMTWFCPESVCMCVFKQGQLGSVGLVS